MAQAKQNSKQQAADAARMEQDDMMALKQWEHLGKQVGQLWMLSEGALLRLCASHGIAETKACKTACAAATGIRKTSIIAGVLSGCYFVLVCSFWYLHVNFTRTN